MISQYYGENVSIAELETLTKMDDDGTSLLDLSTAADSIGFGNLAVQISFDEFIEAPLPAIVHWKKNHFVVVYDISTNAVFVADPAIGKIEYSIKQFCKGWMNSEDRTLGDGITIIFAPK
jgi:ATP-binding cassette subfamily B protein